MKRFILIIVILLLFGCSTKATEKKEESDAIINQSQEIDEMSKKLADQFTFHIVEIEDVFGDKTGEVKISTFIYGDSSEFGYNNRVVIRIDYGKVKDGKGDGIGITVLDFPSLRTKLATDIYELQYKTNSGTKMIAYARPTVGGDSWRITDTRQGQTCSQFLKSLIENEKIQVYMKGIDYPTNNCKFEIDTENFKTIYDAYFKNK